MIRRIGIVFLMALLMAACAPQGVDEACRVVAEADSLRQAGQTYDDSLRLAQAYETLSSFCSPLLSTLHPKRSTDYAHACYHYGRLLRRADDPVAAMQVFISGTHSGTDDHHILGRIYSNMGSICHLAIEYQLSYDMYEITAQHYYLNHDTLLYYYSLNDMAIELAEQGKKDSCNIIVNQVLDLNYPDSTLNALCYFSKAEGFLKWKQYDSVIVCAYQSKQYYPDFPSATLQLAQAYSFLGIKDSAVFYAKQVMELSNALFDQNNALYILTQDDESTDKDAALKISADRSDVQKRIEIQHGNLSQAVQLLDQDLHRKPDWRWLYAIVGALALVGIGTLCYRRKKRKQHRLLSQQIDLLEQQYTDKQKAIEQDVLNKCALLRANNSLTTTLAWSDYDKMCRIVDTEFYMFATKLRNLHVLNETEIRLCVLVLIGLNRSDISETLPYSLSGVGKLKDQSAKKLGTSGKELQKFLLKMVVKH